VGGNGSTRKNVRGVSNGKAPACSGTVASGRRVSFKYLDNITTSFFFTKFPDDTKHSALCKLFACYGHVAEVFVPKKLDRWGRKFCFVKFKDVRVLEDLEARLEEVWLGDVRLKVNRARFGREEQKVRDGRRSLEVEEGIGVTTIPGKSFKNAWTLEKDNFPALPGVVPCLDILPSEEMLDYLSWAFVGDLVHQLEAVEVQQALVMEGIQGVKVTQMGGRKVLLHFEGLKDIDPVRNNHLEW